MSEVAVESNRAARFGLFRADLRTGELWRDGTRIHLQDQPFRMLELLLAVAGELVTREELKSRLWPDQSYVSEAALNTCATRLRLALDDNADSPQFVETVARRGYRFVAPVEFVDNGNAAADPGPAPSLIFAPSGDPPSAPAAPPRMRPSTVAIVAVTAAVAALLISILGVVLLWHHIITTH